ncbi:Na+/H+ antiporter [Microlunatus spumicola]|uniref:Na+/H+ antiporter n=1 Tax=Microlunatus spumicola TaxID=81499 RepID=A0ABP6XY98_9ACTN
MEIALEVLGIAAVVVAVSGLAERLRVSAPLLLLLVGVGGSYLPFIDEPVLSSEVVLLGFLPPLLYSAAIRTSIIDFRHNLRPIAYLSVLLVLITALGVGVVTWWLLPVSFPLALALGAVVAPPDAVAATSIARSVGLPRRVVTILEGESLVNDATAITCLRVAIAAIGGSFSVFDAGLGFLIALLGGVAVGLAVGALAVMIRVRVRRPVYDTAISFMVPFAAYLPAEFVGYHESHGSGVIAVVTAGLLLGHKSQVIQSGQSRLNERVNWGTIQFLLENTVFLLIGLQARRTVAALADSPLSGFEIAVFCVAVLLTVIVLRMIWVFLMRISLFRRQRDGDDDEVKVPWQATLVVGWAGLRGVVTLATVLLIPDNPTTHEIRPVLIFAAMVVTFGTLLLQGLTLPPLVRALRLRGPDARSDALQAATVLTTSTTAALKALDDLSGAKDNPEVVDRVRDRLNSGPERLWERLGDHSNGETPAEAYRRLRLQTLQVQRDSVLKVRSNGTVDHEVIEEVLDSFDIEESMLTISGERADEIDEADDEVRTPVDPIGPCEHLEAAPTEIDPDGDGRCLDCVREHLSPVHLRICLTCGNVGCCDSSPGRHADKHFHTTRHKVMRSFEPNEDWRWCYVDERLG